MCLKMKKNRTFRSKACLDLSNSEEFYVPMRNEKNEQQILLSRYALEFPIPLVRFLLPDFAVTTVCAIYTTSSLSVPSPLI